MPLWELALQADWAQTLTTFLLKLQTYPGIKSPLHFYGTSGLLSLINLFLSHLLTPTTRILPSCRQQRSSQPIIKMPLTEAEDIKKRWKEYTEELYKKDLQDPDNHDGMITHLEPDILECEVKRALGSQTKLEDVMEFQLSYFKS